jgi:hypothetical protein
VRDVAAQRAQVTDCVVGMYHVILFRSFAQLRAWAGESACCRRAPPFDTSDSRV